MANIVFSESTNVANSIYGDSQAPIKLFLEKRAESFEQESVIKNVFAMGTSKHWAEKYTSMTAMDGFQPVGENGAYPVDGMQEGYDKLFVHETWKDSFSLSREIIDDSVVMDLKKKPLGFITGYYRTRELLGAALFGGAITGAAKFRGKTFDVKTADGVNLFATNHPSKLKKGDQANKFSDAFSVDALGAMETAMQQFKGDNGEILDVTPNTILIPNDFELKKAVFAAIGADKDPATANNGFNYQFGRWNVIVWTYLNNFIAQNSKPWMLLDTRYSEENGGAVWLDRVGLDIKSTIDENTDANVWRGYSRFSAGFHDWRFAALGGVTGGSKLLGAE